MAATSDGEVIIVYDENFVGLACDNTSWLTLVLLSMSLHERTSSHPTHLVYSAMFEWEMKASQRLSEKEMCA